ncbi:TetR/AcrR family transcriptional regulator [[Mycobacterium] holstebronense]|uniref:TetR/AcrR family transcriptional regulator n=1 Tax=[Mycobacterium] holstebronense TaxID=3064288 RepID=A0ABM9LAV0_9MYCO|nr:TetR/AcrR family transcriptional regulator [Mycolicibacter sp. MU0102]CAJ1495914.1 TetR/AcrR family transcriptional regulator [Mycolicibacter sp. MU0102]
MTPPDGGIADGTAARPTVRGRDTQARLERAAREVIARKGFFKTTITDITSAAKRSPASFYHYFGSKEELLASLAEDFRAMARSRAVQALHPGQDLREIIQESVRAHWDTYREHLGVMVGVFQLAMIDDAFAQRWREMCADAIDWVAQTVRMAQRQGYSTDADPELVGSAIVAMLNHFTYVWLVAGGDVAGRELDEEAAIKTLTDTWYRSVSWRDQGS